MPHTNSSYKALLQNEYDNNSATAGAVIEQAIKDTYQEVLRFCGRFLIPSEFDDIDVTTGTADYTPEEYLDIIAAHWKKDSDDRFMQLRPWDMAEFAKSQYIDAPTGQPFRWLVNGAASVKLVPAPNADGTLRLVVIPVQPELAGNVVSVVPDRFTKVILMGALARMKDYDNLSIAQEYYRAYWGPNGSQGVIQGALGDMIRELSTQGRGFRPALGRS
jgi:hypothetical protein